MAHASYSSGVDSLMYGMVCNSPDLVYTVSVISRFMANPSRKHWEELKWTLRYLRGSISLGLLFKKQEEGQDHLVGYVDSNYVGSLNTRKSLICYILHFLGLQLVGSQTCN